LLAVDGRNMLTLAHEQRQASFEEALSGGSVAKIVASSLGCFVVLLAGAVAQAQTRDAHACTAATLNGAYGVLHDGVVFREAGHLAEIGVARFDGAGHWTLEATLISQGSGLTRVSNRDGSYTVKADCTGSSSLGGSQTFTFDFVVLDDGKELIQLATRSDRAVTWEVMKQDVNACTNATLAGRYAVLQTGFDAEDVARAGAGVITFDGNGKWSLRLTEVKKDSPILHIENPNGTYTVNADCRGSASLARTPIGTANWEFVIVDGGKEVFQVVTTPPRGVVLWRIKKQFFP
jgi:hypothetical protein